MSDTQSPLLSDEQIEVIAGPKDCLPYHQRRYAVLDTLEAVQSKIASGELRVAKTVRLIQKHPGGPPISNTEVPMNCPNCGAFDVPSKTQWWKFCPGCGSMIVE